MSADDVNAAPLVPTSTLVPALDHLRIHSTRNGTYTRTMRFMGHIQATNSKVLPLMAASMQTQALCASVKISGRKQPKIPR